MTDEVKAGQVWQHKNSGRRWVVTEDGEAWVGITREDSLRDLVKKTVLVDDFILVKDAP